MVIDFHTHVFPDKIAARSIQTLEQVSEDINAFTDGTLQGLLDSMDRSGIDRSVILPVATRKGQFDTINRFAREINRTYDRLYSFGGIHPDDDEVEDKLRFLKDNGFRGIKIHPDYTGVCIDDERYIRIITAAARLGLLVVTHAGVDPAFDQIHCTPQKGRAVMDHVFQETGVRKPFLVFAHLGGILVHKDVQKYLIGTDCYLDISCSFRDISPFCDTSDEDVAEVIRSHGAERILFASDSPWNDQKAYREKLLALSGVSEQEKELIFHQNAEKLLAET